MAYTLEQIYEALGKVENGAEMTADLQDAIHKTREEAAKNRVERNKARDEAAKSRTAMDGILDKLNLRGKEDADTSLDELVETLKALQSAGNDPRRLGVQMKSLQKQVKDLTDKYDASEKRAKEEHDKRVRTAVRSKVLDALTQGKAIKPDAMYKILEGNISIDENDNAFYRNGEDELSLEDGVAQWLKDNQWAVKAETQTGAGGGTDAKRTNSYTMEDLKKMSPAEINAHWGEISKGVQK